MPDTLFPQQRRSALLQALRELFQKLGGNVSMRVLASEAIKREVIPAEELARCQMRGITALCRAALKAKTENGLPFAQPTRDGGGSEDDEKDTWKQIELFTYEEACSMIDREAKAISADYHELLLLHRWCHAKFGKAPEIPELREIETA